MASRACSRAIGGSRVGTATGTRRTLVQCHLSVASGGVRWSRCLPRATWRYNSGRFAANAKRWARPKLRPKNLEVARRAVAETRSTEVAAFSEWAGRCEHALRARVGPGPTDRGGLASASARDRGEHARPERPSPLPRAVPVPRPSTVPGVGHAQHSTPSLSRIAFDHESRRALRVDGRRFRSTGHRRSRAAHEADELTDRGLGGDRRAERQQRCRDQTRIRDNQVVAGKGGPLASPTSPMGRVAPSGAGRAISRARRRFIRSFAAHGASGASEPRHRPRGDGPLSSPVITEY